MDPVTLTSVGSVSVPSMTGRSGSMAACPIQKSLYVTCYKKKEMLKIRVAGAHLCLSVCLSVCLSACLSVCPSVCPSFASVCVSATGLNLFVICIFTVFVKYCRPNQSHLPNFVTFWCFVLCNTFDRRKLCQKLGTRVELWEARESVTGVWGKAPSGVQGQSHGVRGRNLPEAEAFCVSEVQMGRKFVHFWYLVNCSNMLFTALHGMQTRCCEKNSVRPSVCPKSYRIPRNYAAVMAITPFKVIQGHRFWYQSKAHIRLSGTVP